MPKIKIMMAFIAGYLPFHWLRTFAYRLFFGYAIHGARIGFGTIIAVSAAKLDHCQIGRFNQFVGPMQVEIADAVRIGDQNKFICGGWTLQFGEQYARHLAIKERASITSAHYFDVCGSIELGAGSWVAGIGSQFWTHGPGVKKRYILIGKDCYIGSAVRFAPGASLGNGITVAMGSVVSKRFSRELLLIGGVPAVVILSHYNWKQYRDQLPENPA